MMMIYLVERGFSTVANLLIKKRNKLDITNGRDLGLNLTNLKSIIQNLLSKSRTYFTNYHLYIGQAFCSTHGRACIVGAPYSSRQRNLTVVNAYSHKHHMLVLLMLGR